MSLIIAQKKRIKMLSVKQMLAEIGIFLWMFIFIYVAEWASLEWVAPKTILPLIVELLLCYGLAIVQIIICAMMDDVVIKYFDELKEIEERRLDELVARHKRLGGTYTE